VRNGQKAGVGLKRLAQPKAEIEEGGPRRRHYSRALTVVTAHSAPAVARQFPVAERPRCGSVDGESLRAGQGMYRARRERQRLTGATTQ
jgi:hypothetical protein